MKRSQFNIFVISILFFTINANAQITTHYVEEFSAPSSQGTLANGYNGWTITSTGANGAEANQWFVSCQENGNLIGQCGTPCAGNATLHLGCTFPINDLGASYFAGGIGNCMTHKRAETPIIDCSCSGSPVYLEFRYLARGQANTDFFSLDYWDGTAWTVIVNPPTTPLTCSPQGKWTGFGVALPLSAVNNPNVKIGFRWENNNDAVGTDPSVAIDSIFVYSQAILYFPDFTYSPSSPCFGDSVTFTNTTFGPASVWAWDFGGGGSPNTSTLQNPTVLFSTAGNYVVTLTASDNCGSPPVSNAYLVIINNCISAIADFTTPNTILCEGDSVLFTDLSLGSPTSFEWSFQGGNPSSFSGQNPPYITYSTVGSYNVTLIVANGFGSDTLLLPGYITVNNCQLPVANFSTPITTLCSPTCITFTDASVPTVNITGWNWVFTGGVPAIFSGQFPPQICYNTPGVYDVELTVDDGINFNTLTMPGYITVNNCQPPTAAFNTPSTNLCESQCITFTNQSVLSTSWNWTFAGGTPSSFVGQNPPQICYSTSGTFDVRLIVSNTYGIDTLLQTAYISVASCVPTAGFSAAITSGCNGDCFTITNQSVGATSWNWTFPGGTPAIFIGQNPPPICYTNPGTYDVSLLVSNIYGADSILQTGFITITYCNLLNAQFFATDTFICEGDCISFVDQSAGAPIGWLWVMPGGVPDTLTAQNPPYVCYPNAGNYPVTLFIFNIGGIDSVVYSNYITVNAGTFITTNIDSATIYQGDPIQLVASGGVSYLWSPDIYLDNIFNSSPIASPIDTTNYQVVMTDANGCSSVKSILINVIPPETVWAPTAFTPNNDQVNDVFYIKAGGIITKYVLKIFDRWGEMVFTSNDQNDGWDGTYQSKELNVGVYLYYYKVEFVDGVVIEKSGDVTLLK